MKTLSLRPAVAVTALLLKLIAATPAAAQLPAYQITDIGTLNTFSDGAYLCALNNLGQVVGTRETGQFNPIGFPIYHAFLWDSTHGTTDLGTLGGTNSYASDINDRGQIVGTSDQNGGLATGFLWQQGRMNATSYHGNAINNSGQIAGSASHSAIRDSNGVVQVLGTLGGDNSYGRGINAQGQVVGDSEYDPQTGSAHAFLWDPSRGMGDLDAANMFSSYAFDINDSGQVVGTSSLYGATLWQNGNAIPLGNSVSESGALAINNEGQIVGYGRDRNGLASAMLWHDGQMYDLNALVGQSAGWRISYAEDINDSGQIVCLASPSNGSLPIHALLLTPVPEPGVLGWLSAAAVTGGTMLRRGRRHLRSRVRRLVPHA